MEDIVGAALLVSVYCVQILVPTIIMLRTLFSNRDEIHVAPIQASRVSEKLVFFFRLMLFRDFARQAAQEVGRAIANGLVTVGAGSLAQPEHFCEAKTLCAPCVCNCTGSEVRSLEPQFTWPHLLFLVIGLVLGSTLGYVSGLAGIGRQRVATRERSEIIVDDIACGFQRRKEIGDPVRKRQELMDRAHRARPPGGSPVLALVPRKRDSDGESSD